MELLALRKWWLDCSQSAKRTCSMRRRVGWLDDEVVHHSLLLYCTHKDLFWHHPLLPLTGEPCFNKPMSVKIGQIWKQFAFHILQYCRSQQTVFPLPLRNVKCPQSACAVVDPSWEESELTIRKAVIGFSIRWSPEVLIDPDWPSVNLIIANLFPAPWVLKTNKSGKKLPDISAMN